jgi:hypothetical protein
MPVPFPPAFLFATFAWCFLPGLRSSELLSGHIPEPADASPAGGGAIERVWARHTIDDGSRGADGVKLADLDRDGRLDVVTGWEEGGVVRICRHPGPAALRERWPAATIGEAESVEDATPIDLDGDGYPDVVSCSEGSLREARVHWSPGAGEKVFQRSAWRTGTIPASAGRMQWMFCVEMDVDGRHGIDIVAGAKGKDAAIGWFEAPPDPRRLEDWTWHPLRSSGWTMSLEVLDMDADGRTDILLSDRKGGGTGCHWLERPPASRDPRAPWPCRLVGAKGREAMFLRAADLDGDGAREVLVATKPRDILVLAPPLDRDGAGGPWIERRIGFPETFGTAKAVAAGDLDLDGRMDLVVTCEDARASRSGVLWLRLEPATGEEAAPSGSWKARDLGGPEGTKYDLAELIDLDGDGDLDVLTCEEADGLGVIWYENPVRPEPERP